MLCGLTYDDVWVNLKPTQVKEYIEGYNKKQQRELQIKYNLCWLNAAYAHISRHNGKNFPRGPEQIYKEEVEAKQQSDAEQDLMIDFILQKIK